MLSRFISSPYQQSLDVFHKFKLLNGPNFNYGVKSGLSFVFLLFGGFLLHETLLGLTAALGVVGIIISGADEPKKHFWLAGAINCLHFFIAPVVLLVVTELHVPYLWTISLFTFLFAMYSAFGITGGRLGVATLLLVILTRPADNFSEVWITPALYALGAFVHIIICRTWHGIWPYKALRENLAAYYFRLSEYVTLKSSLMTTEPFDNRALLPLQQSLTSLLLEGEKLVKSFSATNNQELKQLRDLYFLGKELHELFSSTTHAPDKLYPIFQDSNVKPVFTALMDSYAKQLKEVGEATLHHHTPEHTLNSKGILDLRVKLYLTTGDSSDLVKLADEHFSNLTARLTNLKPSYQHEVDFAPQVHWFDKLKSSLSWQSVVLRHALRFTAAIAVGYGIGQFFQFENSYWILMTITIVMQSDYVSTRAKAMNRVLGTIIGLALAYVILSLSPASWVLLLLICLIVPVFFSFIKSNYSIAVIGITIFVISEFQMLAHSGLNAITPRLWDTLIACAIAVIANMVLWPQWNTNRLKQQIGQTLSNFDAFLETLLNRYSVEGESDNAILESRRVAAYQAQHELINRYQQALREPLHSERYLEHVKLIRQHTHTFLNHTTNLSLFAKKNIVLPDDLLQDFLKIERAVFQACYQLLEGKEVSWPAPLVEASFMNQTQLCDVKQKQVAHQFITTMQVMGQIFEDLKSIREKNER
ncbi:FUSC family protein [Vibrio sp. S4M6]|uniref:FUSC family membrane protein n=1 Tax=Vibrio sinus TaxID=2946865 RepID=UPI002029DDF4|nr:FUSC family membrane protein [Vibrio sinus]MCL9783327.1 FUSC family protein [Vibrio sinus]